MGRRSVKGVRARTRARVCVCAGQKCDREDRGWKPKCQIKCNVIPNCLIKVCDVISRRSGVHARYRFQTMA